MSNSEAPSAFKVGLTPEEKKLYSNLFKNLSADGTGIVTGEKARITFEKSGLPPNILGEIWQLADPNNLGFLTQFGFCYAMRLIGYTQSGKHPTVELGLVPGPLPKFSDMGQVLQSQVTNNSLMQSQPSSIVPSNTTVSAAMDENSIAPLSSADLQKFTQLFIKTVGSPNGELDGARARDIFLKAKLSTSTLGQIWNLVDRNNSGNLNLSGFVVAMHLIQGLLSGSIRQLPFSIPERVWESVSQNSHSTSVSADRQVSSSSMVSQQTTLKHPTSPNVRNYSISSSATNWEISVDKKKEYDTIFDSLDKERAGKLNPNQVATFLMSSKLSQTDLATIWDLADINNTGIFSKLEFSIALYLVGKRLSGIPLPNVVPHSLIESIKDKTKSHNEVSAPLKKQDTALDDLVDVFGSSHANLSVKANKGQAESISPPNVPPTSVPTQFPRANTTLTGSFKPTSTFGQELIKGHSQLNEKGLLGDDISTKGNKDTPATIAVSGESPLEISDTHRPQPETLAFPSSLPQSKEAKKAVNYDALRSVPPPPVNVSTSVSTMNENVEESSAYSSPLYHGSASSSSQPVSVPVYSKTTNDDLLADTNPEVSGKLSQATSDIANISNQVKSLTLQTANLHEKKTRAEQELAKILKTKEEIEEKLKSLRVSYQNEVQQYEVVSSELSKAKEEAEALRSEASITEAKLNHISTQSEEVNSSLQSLQNENESLKERLKSLNAEAISNEKRLEEKSAEVESTSKNLSVKKSQLQVIIVKNEEFKNKLTELDELHKKRQEEILNVQKETENAVVHSENLSQEVSKKSAFLATNFTPTREVGTSDSAEARSSNITETLVDNSSTSLKTEGVEPSHNKSASSVSKSNIIEDKELTKESVTESLKQDEKKEQDVLTNQFTSRFPDVEKVTQSKDLEEAQNKNKDAGNAKANESNSDIDKISSGMESFEMVNSEDAKVPEILEDRIATPTEEVKDNNANLTNISNPAQNSIDEEFPPIKELEYDETDSTDNESHENFDDAIENFNDNKGSSNTFGNQLDDLETAKKENLFENEFDDLEEAKPEIEDFDINDFENKNEVDLSDTFTNAPSSNDFGSHSSKLFSESEIKNGASTNDPSDEWEQLFAGFGNHSAPAITEPQITSIDSSHQSAIQELVGMGFGEDVVIEALTKENWNLESATNFLLDNA